MPACKDRPIGRVYEAARTDQSPRTAVCDQTAPGLPQMQLIARQHEPETQLRPGAQVELDLGRGAGKAAVDRAMQAAAR